MKVRRIGGILVVVAAAACSDSSAPTDPDPDREPRVTSVTIEPGSVELDLGETVTLTATVLDQFGAPMLGRTVVWSSTDALVAEVDPSGRVSGVGAGTAEIRAEVEGRGAEAPVDVVPWNIDRTTVVMDSAVLRLVSDSAELAVGVYRFEILGSEVPAIAPGGVVIGAQGEGFLRRVTATDVSGGILTLQTTQAALVDVVRHGSFTSALELVSAPATLEPGREPAPGEVLWGPVELVDPLPGVALGVVGLDLSGVDFCQAINCPNAIKSLKLVSGTVGFNPTLDLGATIVDYELTEFHGIATGALTLDFQVLLEASQSAAFNAKHTLATLQRVFYAQIGWLPVVGIVKFEVEAAFDAKATVKGRIQGGFGNEHSLSVGARYAAASGWTGVLEGSQSFTAHEPSLSDSTLIGQIELEARISVTPELRIVLYGVAGPFINVEPYGKATLSFGTEACALKSVAGIDSKIGFAVSMLDPSVGTFSHTFSPFTWPGLDWECPLGHLDVATITNGEDPDEDGYRILVDGEDKGAVAATGSALVEWVRVGTRSVELTGVEDNCTVDGDNPREVDVEIALTIPLDFTIECEPKDGTVYEEDFNSGSAGTEWSSSAIEVSPSGERFLGLFNDAEVLLSLTGLPAHDSLKLELDLYIIEGWNGNGSPNPDLVEVWVEGIRLLRTTFSNVWDDEQAYPGQYPGAENAAGSGAHWIETLGFPRDGDEEWGDTSYRLTFTVPHASSEVTVRLLANPTGSDETWGIDNVRVSVR